MVGGLDSRTLWHSASVLGVRVGAAVFAYTASVIIGRIFGASATGEYFIVLVFVSLISVVGAWGQDVSLLREVGGQSAQSRARRSGVVISPALVLVFVTTTAALFALTVAWPVMADWLQLQSRVFYQLTLLAGPCGAFLAVGGAALRGHNRPIVAEVLERLSPSVLLVIIVGMSPLLELHSSLVSLATAHFLSRLVPVIVILGLIVSLVPLTRPSLQDARTAEANGRPFLALGVLYLVTGWTDTLMLGWLDTTSSVGAYGAAVRSAGLLLWPLVAMNSVIAPRLAEAHRGGFLKRLAALSRAEAGVLTIISVPLGVFLLVFSNWILSWFGPEFQSATTALRILALGTMVNVLAGPVGFLLAMTGHERWLVRNLVMMTAMNAVLNVLLIPPMGMVGAAIATSATTLGVNVLNSVDVHRRLRFWVLPNPRNARSFWSRNEPGV